MRRYLPIALWMALGGCTAAKASLQIVNAEQALSRANSEGAPEIAAYEYTMANLYLEKAREEAGYSEFRMADALARQSAEWADRAVIFVEKQGRTDIRLEDFELPEATEPAPAPVPAPAPAPADEDWLQASDPTSIPGEGPAAEPEPEPEPEPEEPDPFEIEEDEEDDLSIGDEPNPELAPAGREGGGPASPSDAGAPQ